MAHLQFDFRKGRLTRVLHISDRSFDIVHNRVGALGMAVNHQPARTFRNPHPHHKYHKAETSAGKVRQPPAEIGSDHSRIEQNDGADRTHRRADPKAAVDHQIGPSAITRGHQFLNRRIDCRVFAADAGAGEKSKQRVARDIPGQRRRGGSGEIKRQCDEEQFPAPDPIGEPAEPESAEHGAREIGAVGKSDVEIGELKCRTFFQRTRQCAGQRDLQSIQNPGDAEGKHDAGVETAPAQTVETEGNTGFDDGIIVVPSRRSHCGGRRKNCRIAHAGHAALLQCSPFASSTEMGALQFNADLRCNPCKSIGSNQRESAWERNVPRLSSMKSATFVPAA